MGLTSALKAGQTVIEVGRTAQGLAGTAQGLAGTAQDFRTIDKRELGRTAGRAAFAEGTDAGKTMGKSWLKTFEVIPRLVCRGLQLVFALIVCGFYGNRVDADRKGDDGYSPEWIFALVVAGTSAVTAVLFAAATPLGALPVIGARLKLFKTYRAFAWDLGLFVIWIAVFGLFAGIFLKREGGDEDRYKGARTGAMKIAVWLDLVNAILWLVSGCYGCLKTCLGERADRLTDKVGKKLFEKKQTEEKQATYAESV